MADARGGRAVLSGPGTRSAILTPWPNATVQNLINFPNWCASATRIGFVALREEARVALDDETAAPRDFA
jgi:hypothetical protein